MTHTSVEIAMLKLVSLIVPVHKISFCLASSWKESLLFSKLEVSLVDTLTLLSEDSSDVLNVATDRLLCIVHPDLLPTAAGLYQNLLSVGAKVGVTGSLMVRDDDKSTILWVTSLRLVQSSSQSVTIRQLLDLWHDNQQVLEVEEVAEALLVPYAEANQILSMDATERQWKANQLALHLQQAQTKSVVKPEL